MTIATDINHYIQSIKTDSAKDAVKKYSIAMIAAAFTSNEELYHQSVLSMEQQLELYNKDKDFSPEFSAWMLGRIVQAAVLMKDKTRLERTQKILVATLLDSSKTHIFTTWAWSYLLYSYAYNNPKLYQQYLPRMNDGVNQAVSDYLKEKNDGNFCCALWALACQLQTVAAAKDKKAYDNIVAKTLKITGKSNLFEALSMVDKGDFRGWMMSIYLNSASKRKDSDTVKLLKKHIKTATKEAPLEDNLIARAIQFNMATVDHRKSVFTVAAFGFVLFGLYSATTLLTQKGTNVTPTAGSSFNK